MSPQLLDARTAHEGNVMKPTWHSYVTRIGEQRATVTVDTAAMDRDRRDLSYVVILRTQLPPQGATQVSATAESEMIRAVEGAIGAHVGQHGACYVGRMMLGDVCFLHVYTSRPTDVVSTLKALAARFGLRHLKVDVHEDPEWAVYREVLWPAPVDTRRSEDAAVLNQLRQHGDDLSRRRQIDHWLYFGSGQARDRAAVELVAAGFTVLDRSDPDDEHGQYCLKVRRVDSVQPEDIDSLTEWLLHFAQRRGGDYDGWETSVER